jgi:hypothetical protein
MRESVEFFGYTSSKDGIHITVQIKEYDIIQRPNISELLSFLGLVNFYRSFVPRFAGICELLIRLTQKEVTWICTKEF